MEVGVFEDLDSVFVFVVLVVLVIGLVWWAVFVDVLDVDVVFVDVVAVWVVCACAVSWAAVAAITPVRPTAPATRPALRRFASR